MTSGSGRPLRRDIEYVEVRVVVVVVGRKTEIAAR
jgi:hypothetical protein